MWNRFYRVVEGLRVRVVRFRDIFLDNRRRSCTDCDNVVHSCWLLHTGRFDAFLDETGLVDDADGMFTG